SKRAVLVDSRKITASGERVFRRKQIVGVDQRLVLVVNRRRAIRREPESRIRAARENGLGIGDVIGAVGILELEQAQSYRIDRRSSGRRLIMAVQLFPAGEGQITGIHRVIAGTKLRR